MTQLAQTPRGSLFWFLTRVSLRSTAEMSGRRSRLYTLNFTVCSGFSSSILSRTPGAGVNLQKKKRDNKEREFSSQEKKVEFAEMR